MPKISKKTQANSEISSIFNFSEPITKWWVVKKYASYQKIYEKEKLLSQPVCESVILRVFDRNYRFGENSDISFSVFCLTTLYNAEIDLRYDNLDKL